MDHSNQLQSQNQSDDQFPLISKLKKQVDNVKQKQLERKELAILGKHYLSVLMAQVIYLQLTFEEQKQADLLMSVNYQFKLSEALKLKNTKQLLVALAKVYQEKNQSKIQQIKKDFKSYIQILGDMPKQINQSTLSSIPHNQMHSLSLTMYMNNDAINDANKHQYYKEVKNYMQGKNYSTMMNLLVNYKANTFQYKKEPVVQVNVNNFTQTSKLLFNNFLVKGQEKQKEYIGLGKGKNKKQADNSACESILNELFNQWEYIFRDFVHLKGNAIN